MYPVPFELVKTGSNVTIDDIKILMKKLYARGELDTAKINTDEWIDDFNSRDEAFRKQFR